MATLTNYIIPLTNAPQTFQINLANVDYTMTVKWNDQMQSWILDLADSANNMLAAGMPFVTGADLLEGLEYLGLNGTLIVYVNGLPYQVPTLDDLGADANLYFQTSVPDTGTGG